MMSLVDNIKFQLASVATLFFIMVCWVVIFAKHGLDQGIPAIGTSQSSLIGFVLNNFAFVSPAQVGHLAPLTSSFISDYNGSFLYQRALPQCFYTKSHYISYLNLRCPLYHCWSAGCCKFQNLELIRFTCYVSCVRSEQSLDYHREHSLSDLRSYYFCSSICHCDPLQPCQRQYLLHK
jgi:hypothetical protein